MVRYFDRGVEREDGEGEGEGEGEGQRGGIKRACGTSNTIHKPHYKLPWNRQNKEIFEALLFTALLCFDLI